MFRITTRFLVFAFLMAALSCHRSKRGAGGVPPFSGADTVQVNIVLSGMSLEEKIGQLILWEAPMTDSASRSEVFEKTGAGLVGGLMLPNLTVTDYLYASDSLQRSSRLPLFMATDQKVSLHNHFQGLINFPTPASMATIDSSEIQVFLEEAYLRQCKALGNELLEFKPQKRSSMANENLPAA